MKRAEPLKPGEERCPQCYLGRNPLAFINARGHRCNWCLLCRSRYAGWEKRTTAEKLAMRAPSTPSGTGYLVSLALRSGNKKTGRIPVSMTDRASCPPTCTFAARGCYADYHLQRAHWEDVARTGMTWPSFCEAIAALPEGTFWRHNEAGDLPGKGNELDAQALGALVEANRGRRGFTYTHKTGEAHHELYQWANLEGFTINLSADSLEEADSFFQPGSGLTKAGPVVVTLPADAPEKLHTPGGRRVVVCPAQTPLQLTCAECKLCAQPHRRTIIGFRAHGQDKALVSELVRERRIAS